MKQTLLILLGIFSAAMVAGVAIKFRPFSVRVEDWRAIVGWLFIIVGVAFIEYNVERKTARRIKKQMMEYMTKELPEFTEKILNQK